MPTASRLILAATLSALSLAALTWAGEPAVPRTAPASKTPAPKTRTVAPLTSQAATLSPKAPLRRAPARRTARDPFAPPPALANRALPARALPAASGRLAPGQAADPLAGLEVRALIVLRGGRSGAIVSLGGRRWLVRKGDRFPLSFGSAQITRIDREGLALQVLDAKGSVLGAPRLVRQ